MICACPRKPAFKAVCSLFPFGCYYRGSSAAQPVFIGLLGIFQSKCVTTIKLYGYLTGFLTPHIRRVKNVKCIITALQKWLYIIGCGHCISVAKSMPRSNNVCADVPSVHIKGCMPRCYKCHKGRAGIVKTRVCAAKPYRRQSIRLWSAYPLQSESLRFCRQQDVEKHQCRSQNL